MNTVKEVMVEQRQRKVLPAPAGGLVAVLPSLVYDAGCSFPLICEISVFSLDIEKLE